MSCECNRVYAGPTANGGGLLSSIAPTNGDMGSAPVTVGIMPHYFCWKCFAFWGVVAVVVLLLLSDGGE